MLLPRRVAGVLVVACAAVVACSDTGTDDTAAPDPPPQFEPHEEAPPEEVPADPPTIIVTGDSMIYDVSPAVVEALSPAAATVVAMVTPSLAQESSRVPLLDRIDELQPDVVVVMVGIWERGHVTTSGYELGDAGFEDEYVREALEPVTARLAAVEGHLLLLGPPHIRVASDDAQLAQLEQIWDGYARSNDRVDFVDTDSWLIDAEEFVELTSENGAQLRLRRIDGLHLCEEGARRIAAGLIGKLDELLAAVRVEPEAGWETGSWTARFPDDECPP